MVSPEFRKPHPLWIEYGQPKLDLNCVNTITTRPFRLLSHKGEIQRRSKGKSLLIHLLKPIFGQKNTFLDPFLHYWKRRHQDDFWTVILQILELLFQILQDSDIFASSNQSIFAFVLYKIHQNKIPYVEILSLLKNSL